MGAWLRRARLHGIPKVKVAAIVFVIAGLSARAAREPVGDDDRRRREHAYVGSSGPHDPLCGCGAADGLLLGWEGGRRTSRRRSTSCRQRPRHAWWKVIAPFAVFGFLVFMGASAVLDAGHRPAAHVRSRGADVVRAVAGEARGLAISRET